METPWALVILENVKKIIEQETEKNLKEMESKAGKYTQQYNSWSWKNIRFGEMSAAWNLPPSLVWTWINPVEIREDLSYIGYLVSVFDDELSDEEKLSQ